jgi:hypothetical protein
LGHTTGVQVESEGKLVEFERGPVPLRQVAAALLLIIGHHDVVGCDHVDVVSATVKLVRDDVCNRRCLRVRGRGGAFYRHNGRGLNGLARRHRAPAEGDGGHSRECNEYEEPLPPHRDPHSG